MFKRVLIHNLLWDSKIFTLSFEESCNSEDGALLKFPIFCVKILSKCSVCRTKCEIEKARNRDLYGSA